MTDDGDSSASTGSRAMLPAVTYCTQLDAIGTLRAYNKGMQNDGKAHHEFHREAAEMHDNAAKAHRTAAEHNEKGDHASGSWHAERALEYADHAYKLAREAHTKSGQIESL